MMGNQVADSKLIEEYFAKGGKARKMPIGASCRRPSTLPRADRDAYVQMRRQYSPTTRKLYLSIPQIHEIEAMIEHCAPREEIAKFIGIDPDDIFKLVEKLEYSGIAYPEYLRQPMESPFDALRDLPIVNFNKSKVKPQSHLRPLTSKELRAIENIRTGISAKVEVKKLGVAYDTFIKLIAIRFGSIAQLRAYKSNKAVAERLALFPTKGAI